MAKKKNDNSFSTKGKKNRQIVFLGFFKDLNFHVSNACLETGISRKTYYDWKNEGGWFAEQIEEMMERKLDNLEEHLYNQSEASNVTATIFALKTQAKERGYGDEAPAVKIDDITINIVGNKTNNNADNQEDE